MNKSFILKKIKEYLEKKPSDENQIKDIHYWFNPEDNTWNPSVLIDGKKARLRAGIIIIKDGSEILLGEEESEPGVFSLPGGAIDKGESQVGAAVREAQEEVHIKVKNARYTGIDYCVKNDEVMPWVKDHVPEKEWWYHYYTKLVIADYDGEYNGKIANKDKDPNLLKTSRFYKFENVINNPSFKPEWKQALVNFGYIANEDKDLDEKVEIHTKLNPKIWDKNNSLLPGIEDKIYQIVEEFKLQIEEAGVKLAVKDVYLLGSNANYNYNDDSDLDIHIMADESFDCKENHLPIIYNAYKSLFNSKYDITINGLEVELYVENIADITNISTGVYSLKKGWIKEPSQLAIPKIDEAALEKVVADWEKKYLEIMNSPSIDKIDKYIDDLYELRTQSMKKDGEFAFDNLVFKEIRRLHYFDNLKIMRLELKNEELSLK